MTGDPLSQYSSGLKVGPEIGLQSARLLQEIPLLISCGNEKRRLRRLAKETLERYNQFLRHERGGRYALTEWDFEYDLSRDEEVGHTADRSVRAVAESEGVIAILGHGVPPITRLEIRRVYELRGIGQERWLSVLVHRPPPVQVRPGDVPLSEFLGEIKRDFGKERIYHDVKDGRDFQVSLMMELLPFLIERTGDAFGPIGEGRRGAQVA